MKVHRGHYATFDADHKTIRLHDAFITPVTQGDILPAEHPPFRTGAIVALAMLAGVLDLPMGNAALSHPLRSVIANRDRRIYGFLLRNQSRELI